MYVYVYIYVHIYIFAYTQTRLHTHVRAHEQTRTLTHTHTRTRTHTHTHTHSCTYLCVCVLYCSQFVWDRNRTVTSQKESTYPPTHTFATEPHESAQTHPRESFKPLYTQQKEPMHISSKEPTYIPQVLSLKSPEITPRKIRIYHNEFARDLIQVWSHKNIISTFKKNTHITGEQKAFRIRTKASPKEPEEPIDISSKEPMHISQKEPSESAQKLPRNSLKNPRILVQKSLCISPQQSLVNPHKSISERAWRAHVYIYSHNSPCISP